MTAAVRSIGNVRKIRPGRREQLEAQIALLDERQYGRLERLYEVEELIERRQLEIDNLRQQLEVCDE